MEGSARRIHPRSNRSDYEEEMLFRVSFFCLALILISVLYFYHKLATLEDLAAFQRCAMSRCGNDR